MRTALGPRLARSIFLGDINGLIGLLEAAKCAFLLASVARFLYPVVGLAYGRPSVVDLAFVQCYRELSKRMSNPKPHWNPIFAGVPLVLTFVNELAAAWYGCQNRDASR